MTTPSFALPTSLTARLLPIWRYRVMLFIVFVAGLGGYLVLQINSAINIAPANDTVTAAPLTPRLDTNVVKQLQQLQDNSVSVKALFNQQRDNPFQ